MSHRYYQTELRVKWTKQLFWVLIFKSKVAKFMSTTESCLLMSQGKRVPIYKVPAQIRMSSFDKVPQVKFAQSCPTLCEPSGLPGLRVFPGHRSLSANARTVPGSWVGHPVHRHHPAVCVCGGQSHVSFRMSAVLSQSPGSSPPSCVMDLSQESDHLVSHWQQGTHNSGVRRTRSDYQL